MAFTVGRTDGGHARAYALRSQCISIFRGFVRPATNVFSGALLALPTEGCGADPCHRLGMPRTSGSTQNHQHSLAAKSFAVPCPSKRLFAYRAGGGCGICEAD